MDHAQRREESGPPAHGHDSRAKGSSDVRERESVRRKERGGEREREAAARTLERRGDLGEAQRKTKAKEGTLARRKTYARHRGRREGNVRRGWQRRGEMRAAAQPGRYACVIRRRVYYVREHTRSTWASRGL